MDERDVTLAHKESSAVAKVLSADSMRDFGYRLANLLRPGDVILLLGKLGAGKTTLVQGIANGLGVDGRVTSPTFVLLQEYEGQIPLRHADLYRLEHMGEIADLGIEELLGDSWVTVVEWGDAMREMISEYLIIEINCGAEMTGREIHLRALGREWSERLEDVETALMQVADSTNMTTGDNTADSGD